MNLNSQSLATQVDNSLRNPACKQSDSLTAADPKSHGQSASHQQSDRQPFQQSDSQARAQTRQTDRSLRAQTLKRARRVAQARLHFFPYPISLTVVAHPLRTTDTNSVGEYVCEFSAQEFLKQRLRDLRAR